MSEKISIILPVYNEKESLLIMVRLLNSSLKINSEIIIVHDNQTDNSIESAKILQKEFNNVQIIHNKIGPGVRNAIETGISNSSNEIIIFCLTSSKMCEFFKKSSKIGRQASKYKASIHFKNQAY